MSRLQFWLQFISNILALVQKVPRFGTCKNPLNIVNFQIRSVLASMQKNWSLLVQNLCFFRIVFAFKINFYIFEFSPVLAEVQ